MYNFSERYNSRRQRF